VTKEQGGKRQRDPKILFPLRERTVKLLIEVFEKNKDKIYSPNKYAFASDLLDAILEVVKNGDVRALEVYLKFLNAMFKKGYLPVPFSVVSKGKMESSEIKENFRSISSSLVDGKGPQSLLQLYFFTFLHSDNVNLVKDGESCYKMDAILAFPIMDEGVIRNFYLPSLEGLVEGMGYKVVSSAMEKDFVKLKFCK
jgi:hypothetical protein